MGAPRRLVAAIVTAAVVGAAAASPAVRQEAQDLTATLWPSLLGAAPSTARTGDEDPLRPVVRLEYRLADDLASARGHERVTFTPSARVCDLVFRLWPNSPTVAANGSRMRLTSVTIDGQRRPVRFAAAGARQGTQGTLARVALPACVPAQRRVTAEADFTIVAGAGGKERVGHTARTRTAWYGSAFPMLPWVRGRGWVTSPAVNGKGESETSEEFALAELAVIVPRGTQVVGGGNPAGQRHTAGHVTYLSTAPAVRDVAFAAGKFQTATVRAAGVTVHAAVPAGSDASARTWAQAAARPATRMADLFGKLPYSDVWLLPVLSDFAGIEFPQTILLPATTSPAAYPKLVPHEWAHQYFYSLLGDDQGQDPWLDEAFATYAEALVDGTEGQYLPWQPDSVEHAVGKPLAAFGGNADAYNASVYVAGAKALLRARAAAGPTRFDAAVRGYVAKHAHGVVTPRDVAAAFRQLPRALAVLRQAHAID